MASIALVHIAENALKCIASCTGVMNVIFQFMMKHALYVEKWPVYLPLMRDPFFHRKDYYWKYYLENQWHLQTILFGAAQGAGIM